VKPRLRHVVLVGDDLEPEARLLATVLGIEEVFREPEGLGLDMRNVVMPVGSSFLEICVGSKPDAPASRYVRANGAGGYMVLLQYPEFEPARDRARSHGARPVWEFDSEEQRECHLHPKDVAGAIVGIEWSRTWDDWRWAGPDWRSGVRTDSVTELAGVTISAADPAALSQRWSDVLGLGSVTRAGRALEAVLGDKVIRFAPWDQPGSRLTGVDLRAADADGVRRRAHDAGCPVKDGAVQLAGVKFRLLDAA
jgi:hypothetical protein